MLVKYHSYQTMPKLLDFIHYTQRNMRFCILRFKNKYCCFFFVFSVPKVTTIKFFITMEAELVFCYNYLLLLGLWLNYMQCQRWLSIVLLYVFIIITLYNINYLVHNYSIMVGLKILSQMDYTIVINQDDYLHKKKWSCCTMESCYQ